eukprot:CAMPEP_0115026832 /NCGR_PEP_ID=MMETSP0216-20121206/35034_1 /TAXON_ID=223996 /ORGANISM="Protocruzia adherens, Strain Boccale" /LENGTH=257 /DNA_ID=CAMNT_0002402089 /DNA_START=47 /DNA_END=817 /DNA_ORIENTATION=-
MSTDLRSPFLNDPEIPDEQFDRISDGKSQQNRFIGFVGLVVSVIAYGSVIPFTASLPAEGFVLKVSWRFLGCLLVFTPLALSCRKPDGNRWTLREIFFEGYTVLIQLAGLIWILWMFSLLYSCALYSYMIGELFGNLTPVFVVAYRFVTGHSVRKLEIVGLAVTLFGGCLTLLSPQETESVSSGTMILAIVLATFAAVCWSGYLLITEKMGETLPTDIVVFATTFSGYILISALTLIFENSEFSFHPHRGLFGLLAW